MKATMKMLMLYMNVAHVMKRNSRFVFKVYSYIQLFFSVMNYSELNELRYCNCEV